MGYSIKSLPKKKSEPKWKVQYVSFKKADAPISKAKMPRKTWDIVKKRWLSLGFNEFMTRAEAKARAQQLNAQLHIKRQEEKLQKIREEENKVQKRYDAVLPMEFVEEFEKRFIRQSDSQTEQGLRKTSRAQKRWKSAQRMIAAIGTDPSDWFYDMHRIYDYFYNLKMSPKYTNALIRAANLWGFFFCKKLGRAFLPVPYPRGFERNRLTDANNEKRGGVSRASLPLTPEELNKAKDKINIENFNWLFLSVWFGLRPKEIDEIQKEEFKKLEVLPTGRKIIWVYQSKVVALPQEDRWKPIPIIFDEQHFALKILKSDTFKRPLLKTMRKYFGDGVTLYGGRKGFSDLMLSKGQSFENISIWMGHATIQRTWRNYKNRRKFHLSGF